MIELNKVVSVSYSLHASENGEAEFHVETAGSDNPLLWLYGVGGMIPAFEENLFGKKVDDSFDFKIPAADAYGVVDPSAVVMIPLDVFKDEQGDVDLNMVKEGQTLPMSDQEGNQLRGTILEVNAEFVKMDFNHPLAGKDLHFTGDVLEVRDATKDEIAHGHAHGPNDHHHSH